MSVHEHDGEKQHLLLMVESAQRAGRSEAEIEKILDDAREDDAALKRAA
jgi:hypothetical protein